MVGQLHVRCELNYKQRHSTLNILHFLFIVGIFRHVNSTLRWQSNNCVPFEVHSMQSGKLPVQTMLIFTRLCVCDWRGGETLFRSLWPYNRSLLQFSFSIVGATTSFCKNARFSHGQIESLNIVIFAARRPCSCSAPVIGRHPAPEMAPDTQTVLQTFALWHSGIFLLQRMHVDLSPTEPCWNYSSPGIRSGIVVWTDQTVFKL